MRTVAKVLGWVGAALLALVGAALTIGQEVAQSLLQDWLGERIEFPQWMSYVVIAGFAVVTLWVVGSALFAPSSWFGSADSDDTE